MNGQRYHDHMQTSLQQLQREMVIDHHLTHPDANLIMPLPAGPDSRMKTVAYAVKFACHNWSPA